MLWKIYDVISVVVSILQLYTIFCIMFSEFKTDKNISKQQENKIERIELYNNILVILSGIMLIIFTILFLAIFRTKIVSTSFFLIISLPFVLEYIFSNSNTVSEIIIKDEIKEKLSIKTIKKIILFCIGITLLTVIFPFEKTVLWIREHIVSGIWNDIVVSLTMMIYLFFILFVGFIYLAFPVKHIRLLFIRIKRILQKDKRDYEPIAFIEKRILGKILIRKFASMDCVILKIVLVTIFPMVFLLDLLIYVFLFLLYLDEVLVKVLKMGVFWIARQISFFVMKMYVLSIDKIVAYAFRLAFILSDMIIVIYLRIKNPFVFSEQFLTVLEYLSSVIVIPMLFEWFYSEKRTIQK